MTTPNDQFADITNRSQEAATTAVRTWADTVQSFANKAAAGQSQLPDLQGAVEQYFDFVEKVLTNQREFARQWASATVNAFEGVTEQAQRATQSVAAHTVNGTEAVVNNAADTARVAGETAADTAGAARKLTNNN
jgi:hypothetical protein